MQPILAYGEGQFASTASGITLSLLAVLLFLVLLGVYVWNTYPADRE